MYKKFLDSGDLFRLENGERSPHFQVTKPEQPRNYVITDYDDFVGDHVCDYQSNYSNCSSNVLPGRSVFSRSVNVSAVHGSVAEINQKTLETCDNCWYALLDVFFTPNIWNYAHYSH